MAFAIIACEVGFWVLLGLGLLVRYGLRRQALSSAILLAVPGVDVVLLAFTAVDLHSGTTPNTGHALAAVYLGFSVAFGHGLITWADRKVAQFVAGGPAPAPKPASGTPARTRLEWREWGLGVLGFAIAAGVAGLLALVAHGKDTTPLFGSLPGLGIALVVWLVFWPLAETMRTLGRSRV